MKGTLLFRSFGAMTALCLLCYVSQAQVKHPVARPSAANKLWSPLSGTGLQHALASASRRHFEVKPQTPKVNTQAPKLKNTDEPRKLAQR